MARVLIRFKNGREMSARPKQAAKLVAVGVCEYVVAAPASATTPEPAPPAPEPTGYAAMAYNELRALVAERGVTAEGRKKDDLIAALEAVDVPAVEDEGSEVAAQTYQRRDLRAEE